MLPLKEAKIIARMLAKKHKIKTLADWKTAYELGLIPKTLPRDPAKYYGK